MAILVYKLTCTVSGKSYVGITARALDTRWFEHVSRARHGSRKFSRLYCAIQKYGYDTFTREIIATTDTQDEARSLECAFIRQLDTFANGYNANEGGHGWLVVPEEVRRKISEAQIGKVITVESRSRMSIAKKGKSECAKQFGQHTQKGASNPRAHTFLIRFPDGSERQIVGLRAFAREHKLSLGHLNSRGRTKGFFVVQRIGLSTTPDEVTALQVKEN